MMVVFFPQKIHMFCEFPLHVFALSVHLLHNPSCLGHVVNFMSVLFCFALQKRQWCSNNVVNIVDVILDEI